MTDIRSALDRRTVLKTAALAGVAQITSPFVVTRARRRRSQDRPRQSADRHLCRARQERTDRRPARARADQRQGRHSRPQGRTAGRGLDQRRCRHRGAKGAQADRPRQGRLPGRQHQLGACRGDGATSPTKRACSTSCRAATPIRSPARTATGTCSASATRRRWKPTRSPGR